MMYLLSINLDSTAQETTEVEYGW